jgi:hypothetical protein
MQLLGGDLGTIKQHKDGFRRAVTGAAPKGQSQAQYPTPKQQTATHKSQIQGHGQQGFHGRKFNAFANSVGVGAIAAVH